MALINASMLVLGLLLPPLSQAVLRSAWVEPDPSVRSVMWNALLGLLKGTVSLNLTRSIIGIQH